MKSRDLKHEVVRIIMSILDWFPEYPQRKLGDPLTSTYKGASPPTPRFSHPSSPYRRGRADKGMRDAETQLFTPLRKLLNLPAYYRRSKLLRECGANLVKME